MAHSQEARDQKAIDHEVRLSRTRAIIHDYEMGEQRRMEARDSWQQTAWMRRQVAEMIAHVSRGELDSLGLTDEMMRELRLGTSVHAAWEALHSARFDEPGLGPSGDRERGGEAGAHGGPRNA